MLREETVTTKHVVGWVRVREINNSNSESDIIQIQKAERG